MLLPRIGLISLGLLFPFSFLSAHPHSFVDLTTEVLVEGTMLQGFYSQWKLDEIASAELIYEIKTAADPKQTEQELTQELTETAVGNHYFSYLHDNQRQPLKWHSQPTRTEISLDGNHIVYHVQFNLSQPYDLRQGAVTLATFEPSYYMGMEYNLPSDVKLTHSQCQVRLVQPQTNEALRLYAASLDKNATPEQSSDDDMQSLGAKFAQQVIIECPTD